jgi:hypothetical protein
MEEEVDHGRPTEIHPQKGAHNTAPQPQRDASVHRRMRALRRVHHVTCGSFCNHNAKLRSAVVADGHSDTT